LDFGTGGVVGRAVHAPMDGEIVRVRASGVGYGRSLYEQTADGRLLVFGHLDGFAEPVASYLYDLQDSTGVYDQDVWPPSGRFRVRAGQIIAWTGRSGTGSPHLHFEIRRVDTAMHPLRAGLAVPDSSTPRIAGVTLVPANDSSYVWPRASRTPAFGPLRIGPRDTAAVAASGAFRVVVEALDQNGGGGWDIEPWRVRVSAGGAWVEARFDSASWATDMAQSDYVYDSGRWTAHGATSLLLAAPAGFRPRPISSSSPLAEPAGVFRVAPGQSLRLETEAEDLAGHVGRREVEIEGVVPPSRPAPPAKPRPDAVLDARRTDTPQRVVIRGLIELRFPKDALFEPARLTFTKAPVGPAPGLVAMSVAVRVDPPRTPLRNEIDVAMPVEEGADFRHCAVFHDTGDGWEFVGNHYVATADTIWGSTRRLGTFALFRDTQPPAITLLAPPRTVAASAYPRWSLEARVSDRGSGVASLPTHFEVDGHIVPTEWDDVVNTMRWRPIHAPKPGTHRVVAVAKDRCGNERRVSGSFVIK
jgi:hypothetical protein